jgi:hypothetical protein
MKPLIILGWSTVFLSIICAAIALLFAPLNEGIVLAGVTLALGFLVATLTDNLESTK